MKDNLYSGKEAQERIIRGIRKCAVAVGGTMGTAGHNALIEALENPGHLATNDGATILAAIHFEDQLEEMGRKIVLEAVSRANKASGDGSSTTTVLTSAILEEYMKHHGEENPMAVKKSLEACVPLIEEAIKKQTRQVVTDGQINFELLKQVATISAEDETIGQTITDIYKEIGVGGIIHWDISKSFDDHYTIGNGITIDGAGFTSPYFADMNEVTGQFTTSLRWKNPKILLIKQKITTAVDLQQLFETLNGRGHKEVVIFCDEFEPTIIPQLVQTRIVRGFKTALVKMPVLWKDYWYQDLAAATGSRIIDGMGLSLKNVTPNDLGTCKNIVVDKENTYIDGISDIANHIKDLETEGSDDSLLRVSRLNTQTARYFVGAKSDSALSYRRLKVEDAINSAYHAIKDGIVAGGGVSLRNCVNSLLGESIGEVILAMALLMPEEQIATNAGCKVSSDTDGNLGLDTRTGQNVDMFEAGIIDSAAVTLNAVQNAISVAATVLTCTVVIQLPRQSFTDTLVNEIMTRKT